MKLRITFLCAFFTISLFGQESFQLSGTIIASDTKEAVSYANAVLFSGETLVKGSSSDDLGMFKISKIPTGKYTLHVSFMGYKTLIKEVVVDKNIDLGKLLLVKEEESLEGVVITAKKPVLKREIDRLVFNIQGTALTEDNTWEVLRRTPGVLIINNTLSIKNSTPTVYINDRKVHLSASEVYQLLEGTSAENVKSVEVITNPPAKYDAQGGTILNIVMTKNLITGYHGSIYGNYTQGVFPRYNVGMNHFYKQGKFNIFGSYNYNQSKVNRDNKETINYLNNSNISSVWNSDINRNTWSKQHTANLNIDYDFDAKNTLSFTGNLLYLPYWKRNMTTQSSVDDRTVVNDDFSLVAKNRITQDKHNLGLNVDYVHKFQKEGEKLSANIHYTNYDKSNDQGVFTNYFVVSGADFDTEFQTISNQKTEIFSGQIDYELPIDESTNFETGIKTATIETDSDLSQFDILNGVATLDAANSDVFDYNETIYAGYASFSKNWEKWSIKVGFRGEQTELKGNSISTNQINTQNYFKIFPTAYVNHIISDNVNVYADFSRRITRPSFDDLNPFRLHFTDFISVAGNPSLQPAISNSYKVGTEIGGKYFIEAFYIYNKNEIYELTIQDNATNTLQYIASNVENNRYYGIDFVTYFSIIDPWNVSITTSFYNNEDTFTLNNERVTQQKWANYTSIDNNFTFLKDQSLSANVSFVYLSPVVLGFSEVSARNLLSISLRKTLWNKNATVSLSVNDIFNGQELTNTTQYANQNSFYRANYDMQTIRLGFRYKFGNTSLRTNQRTKSSAERERLEE